MKMSMKMNARIGECTNVESPGNAHVAQSNNSRRATRGARMSRGRALRVHPRAWGAVTHFLTCLLAAVVAVAPVVAQAAESEGVSVLPDAQEMQRIEAAVDKALEYLAVTQNADGSWPGFGGRNNGINAFCLLAFLGRGHVPGRGPYRDVVDRAVGFLLACQQPTGLYASPNPSHGPMYEHGMSTLAMIEAYGFIPSLEMRKSVQDAVDLIVKSQAANGGWRYQPTPAAGADLSVTVMQVVALRAALNARLEVPDETVEKALAYVKACIVPSGGFAYQPGGGPGAARTAAGCLSMQLLGAFDDEAVTKGLDYLNQQNYQPNIGHFYYMSYYAMQANFQAGGEYWAHWHRMSRDWLLENQQPNGSWQGYSEQGYNGAALCYSTAIAAMCLEVYMHYLPAYQR